MKKIKCKKIIKSIKKTKSLIVKEIYNKIKIKK